MSKSRARSALLAALVATFLAPPCATATMKFGPLQLSGNLQTQNLIRHGEASNPGDLQFVQQRNVARVRIDYDWLQNGRFINKYDIPFIQGSKLFLLWRGVYDSIYTTTPDVLQKRDIHGRAYGGLNVFEYATQVGNAGSGRTFTRNSLGLNMLTPETRDAYAFENTLREWYADIKFRGIPLTLRAGRQQVVWGETDNFRMLDRVNPLDLTWHFQQEIPAPPFGWDEIRRPLIMFKFLYQLPNIWKLSQNFLEWYWNPGDWYPAKQDFLPRPWALPFYNPLSNPVDGVFISGVCETSRFKVGPLGAGMCQQLLNGTTLFKQGDYSRNPMENSQVGVRYHGLTPQGLEFTINYFYQRWSGDDGTNYAPLKGLPLPQTDAEANRLINLLEQGIFPAEFIAPYVHTVGFSANYSDEAYTQTVYRFETVFDSGIPFFDISRETAINNPVLPGIRKKNMWKGMIAFDRPTWVRWLNKKSTVFLTGQFFWHHLLDNPDCRVPTKPGRREPPPGAQTIAQMSSAGKAVVNEAGGCLVGGLDLPSTARPGTSPQAPSYRDKIRDWEALFTLAAFTFYRGGSIIPIVGIAVDPVNQWNMEPFWTVDWFVTTSVAVNIAQRWFVTPRGYSEPIFETWGLAGLNSGRSETSIRLTYQF
jgi:hypothetical protein